MDSASLANAIAAVSALAVVAAAVRSYVLSFRAKQAAGPSFVFIDFGLDRPHIKRALSSTSEMVDPTAARITGTIKNAGKRPAKNVRSLILVLRQLTPEGDEWATIPFPLEIADDMQPDTEWLVESPVLKLIDPGFKGIDVEDYFDPGFYVFVGLAFDDAATSRHERQQAWLRWPGIRNGVISASLVEASTDEKKRLLEKNLPKFQGYL